MKLDNRWITADGHLNEKPIVIRSREAWQSAFESGEFEVCIQIAWQGESRDEATAYPSDGEMQRMDDFHQQLQLQLESDGLGVVVMVITHDGVNQWVTLQPGY